MPFRPQKKVVSNTKKVWSLLVHLKRGSDKTRIQINRNNPHTCIVE